MQNEQILSFSTRYILPYGRGLVFVAAWEQDFHFHCERFVFFEMSTTSWSHSGMSTKMKTADFNVFNQYSSEKEALEAYMDCEGRQLAENDLYSLFLQEASGKVISKMGHVAELTLHPSNCISDLHYLLHKHPDGFTWLLGHTKSIKLKDVAKFVRSIKITKEPIR